MIQDKMRRTGVAAFLLVALTGVWQSAWAFTPGACRQDGEKLCPGVTNDQELIPCLKQHETQLSMDCKVNLAEARDMVRDMKDACQPDVQKFCADIKTGQGRIRRCLKAHESELTSACRAQITAARQKFHIDTSTAAPAAPAAAAK